MATIKKCCCGRCTHWGRCCYSSNSRAQVTLTIRDFAGTTILGPTTVPLPFWAQAHNHPQPAAYSNGVFFDDDLIAQSGVAFNNFISFGATVSGSATGFYATNFMGSIVCVMPVPVATPYTYRIGPSGGFAVVNLNNIGVSPLNVVSRFSNCCQSSGTVQGVPTFLANYYSYNGNGIDGAFAIAVSGGGAAVSKIDYDVRIIYNECCSNIPLCKAWVTGTNYFAGDVVGRTNAGNPDFMIALQMPFGSGALPPVNTSNASWQQLVCCNHLQANLCPSGVGSGIC